ncbi:hypothetical protein IJ843_05440 [bacterium]|nr:hypothetical protein [bacterium]
MTSIPRDNNIPDGIYYKAAQLGNKEQVGGEDLSKQNVKDYTDGLSQAEFKALDKNKDGYLTKEEFEKGMQGKNLTTTQMNKYWSDLQTAFTTKMSSQNKTITETNYDEATKKMKGFTVVQNDGNGHAAAIITGGTGTGTANIKTKVMYSGDTDASVDAKVYTNSANSASSAIRVLTDKSSGRVRNIQTSNPAVNIAGITYNNDVASTKRIDQITINGVKYSGNNISNADSNNIVTIKDANDKVIAKVTIGEDRHITKIQTDFSEQNKAQTEVTLDKTGKPQFVNTYNDDGSVKTKQNCQKNEGITNVSGDAQIAKSNLELAEGKLGEIMDMFAGATIPSDVKEMLTAELTARLTGSNASGITDVDKWVDGFATQYKLKSAVKDSVAKALKGLSTGTALSSDDIGKTITAYAILNTSNATINSKNLQDVRTLIGKNFQNFAGAATAFKELGLTTTDSSQDIVAILKAAEGNSSNGSYSVSEQKATGLRALQGVTVENTRTAKLGNSGAAAKLAQNAESNLDSIFDIFSGSPKLDDSTKASLKNFLLNYHVNKTSPESNLGVNYKTLANKFISTNNISDESTKNSITNALKGLSGKSSVILDNRDIGNAVAAYSILSGANTKNITADNLSKIQNIINNSTTTTEKKLEKIKALNIPTIYTDNEIRNILNAIDSNKDGKTDKGERETLGKIALGYVAPGTTPADNTNTGGGTVSGNTSNNGGTIAGDTTNAGGTIPGDAVNGGGTIPNTTTNTVRKGELTQALNNAGINLTDIKDSDVTKFESVLTNSGLQESDYSKLTDSFTKLLKNSGINLSAMKFDDYIKEMTNFSNALKSANLKPSDFDSSVDTYKTILSNSGINTATMNFSDYNTSFNSLLTNIKASGMNIADYSALVNSFDSGLDNAGIDTKTMTVSDYITNSNDFVSLMKNSGLQNGDYSKLSNAFNNLIKNSGINMSSAKVSDYIREMTNFSNAVKSANIQPSDFDSSVDTYKTILANSGINTTSMNFSDYNTSFNSLLTNIKASGMNIADYSALVNSFDGGLDNAGIDTKTMTASDYIKNSDDFVSLMQNSGLQNGDYSKLSNAFNKLLKNSGINMSSAKVSDYVREMTNFSIAVKSANLQPSDFESSVDTYNTILSNAGINTTNMQTSDYNSAFASFLTDIKDSGMNTADYSALVNSFDSGLDNAGIDTKTMTASNYIKLCKDFVSLMKNSGLQNADYPKLIDAFKKFVKNSGVNMSSTKVSDYIREMTNFTIALTNKTQPSDFDSRVEAFNASSPSANTLSAYNEAFLAFLPTFD